MPFFTLPRAIVPLASVPMLFIAIVLPLGAVDADAVAAVAADDVGKLEAGVDRRLVRRNAGTADHDSHYLVACDRIAP